MNIESFGNNQEQETTSEITSEAVADACREFLSDDEVVDIAEQEEVDVAIGAAVSYLLGAGQEDPCGILIDKGILE